MTINTLQIANRLKAAEKDGRTAEEIALVLQELQDQMVDEVATKEFVRAEIDKLRLELMAEIERLRREISGDMQRLSGELHQLELRLTLRFGAMLAAAVAILGGLNVFF